MEFIKKSTGLEKLNEAKLRVYENVEAAEADLDNLEEGDIVSSISYEGGGSVDDQIKELTQKVASIDQVIPSDTSTTNLLVNQGQLPNVTDLTNRVTVAENDIDAIENKIPSSATSSNKLVSTSEMTTALTAKENSITGAASTITQDDLTENRALISNGDGKVAASYVTNTELGYLSGTVANVQTQLDNKQDAITGAATTITQDNLSTEKALVSDENGKVAASNVTSTELGYLSGLTSSIKDTFDEKLNVPSTKLTVASASDKGFLLGKIDSTDTAELHVPTSEEGKFFPVIRVVSEQQPVYDWKNVDDFKTTQTAVVTPDASGTDVSFITGFSQNTNGEITNLEKKTVRSASTSQTGIVQLNNTLTSTSTSQALTAAQGKDLNDTLSKKLDQTSDASGVLDISATGGIAYGIAFLQTKSNSVKRLQMPNTVGEYELYARYATNQQTYGWKTAIPVPPTTAGTYALRATVASNGAVTYTWVKDVVASN